MTNIAYIPGHLNDGTRIDLEAVVDDYRITLQSLPGLERTFAICNIPKKKKGHVVEDGGEDYFEFGRSDLGLYVSVFDGISGARDKRNILEAPSEAAFYIHRSIDEAQTCQEVNLYHLLWEANQRNVQTRELNSEICTATTVFFRSNQWLDYAYMGDSPVYTVAPRWGKRKVSLVMQPHIVEGKFLASALGYKNNPIGAGRISLDSTLVVIGGTDGIDDIFRNARKIEKDSRFARSVATKKGMGMFIDRFLKEHDELHAMDFVKSVVEKSLPFLEGLDNHDDITLWVYVP